MKNTLQSEPRKVSCGCCTNGCVCFNHRDVPKGIVVKVCDFHKHKGDTISSATLTVDEVLSRSRASAKLLILLLIFAFSARSFAAEPLPVAPVAHTSPASDGFAFHRANDFMFGAVIAGTVGPATKPWIGLVAAEGAGIANEARYGSHFNAGHLAVISAGALASYAILKMIQKHDHRKAAR